MSLTDLMSGFDLAFYAQVGLIIFFAIFVVVVVRACRRPHDEMAHQANLPLDDDPSRQTSPALGAIQENKR